MSAAAECRPEDEHWMGLALEQAALGVGRTAPNPPVGAVIVRDGILLGAGWHRAAGMPHAEREAIADVQARHGAEVLKGATLYVTLEPCSSHGRTPPCTAAVIEAGISRVVYACVDVDPRHVGRADALMQSAGIEVVRGVGEPAARRLLGPFFKVRQTGLPWVIWKTAMSLDGRLTRPPGEGQWLTSVEARADVQRRRSEVDAILTSGETVRRDRPSLTIRKPELLKGRQQPWRVVFTRNPSSLPLDAPMWQDAWKDRTVICSGSDLTEQLRSLVRERGVLSAMTECGGNLAAALFQAGLVDEVLIYVAPLLCGGGIPALAGTADMGMPSLRELEFTQLGADLRIRGRCVENVSLVDGAPDEQSGLTIKIA